MNSTERQRLWKRFRRKWIADDGRTYEPVEAPTEIPLQLWTGSQRPTRIVFFSKDSMLRSWLASQLWLPTTWLVLERRGFPGRAYLQRVAEIHASARVPICFIGDLDPLDLSSFLALRTLEQDFVGEKLALPVTWGGISDPWLRLCRQYMRPGRLALPTLDMSPLEQEHWQVLSQVAPELRAMIGPECAALLDSGKTLAVEGASGAGIYADDFPGRLRDYVKGVVRRVKPRV